MKHRFKNYKVIVVAAMYFSCVFVLAGCGFKDIDKRVFVTGIGIDPAEKEEGGYKVTLKLSLPVASIKSSTGPNYEYLVYEGETLAEAIRILETHTDKILEFGHTKIIVINEELLQENMKDFMDYFVRRSDIQLIAWVAAAKTSAESILRVEPSAESAVSSTLVNFFGSNGTESPFITSTFLYEFRRDMLSDGVDAVLPLVEATEDKKELIVNKSLVVKEKSKPFELTAEQSKYYNTLLNGMSGFSYKAEKEDLTFVINMEKTTVHYKVIMDDGKPTSIKMNVKMIGVIGQSNKNLALNNLKEYDKIAAEAVKKKITDFLTTVQEKNLDPIGFGLRYRTMMLYDKNTISEWQKAYPDLPFDVSVDVALKGTGAIE
ncbi:Ger(x)C family spore germination protein [Psychrobacillus soli]|uniref:Ger(X)C family spore germination protein n=1 Tax=Psychrobacillus soli TaxID=1543965 RepID=A0A544TDR7_9BACI|nr:Ger(x)C family spore germination protein [Psychrobacillus soli]TQR15575.1 Ger(x)C family spore germination protein [Psychrobacillus soli]